MSASNDTNRIETGDLLIETNTGGDVEIHNLSTGTSFTLGSAGVTVPELNTTDGTTINGELRVAGAGTASEEGVTLELENDIYPKVDSNETSGDAPNFNITINDVQGLRPEIHWRRRVDSSDPTIDEAFSVWDNTNNNELFQVLESGSVDIDGDLGMPGNLGVGGGARFVGSNVLMQSGAEIEFETSSDMQTNIDSSQNSDPPEFNIRHYDSAGADEIHWLRNGAETRAFAVESHSGGGYLFSVDDGGDTQTSGQAAASGGFVPEQRGAPSTAELEAGDRMIYTSDGSDAHSAGDLVSARNNAGTIVSQVVAAAVDDA